MNRRCAIAFCEDSAVFDDRDRSIVGLIFCDIRGVMNCGGIGICRDNQLLNTARTIQRDLRQVAREAMLSAILPRAWQIDSTKLTQPQQSGRWNETWETSKFYGHRDSGNGQKVTLNDVNLARCGRRASWSFHFNNNCRNRMNGFDFILLGFALKEHS